MKRLILCLAIVMAAACDLPLDKTADKAKEIAGLVTYARDARTGLCFAMLGSSTYYGYVVNTLATVPCGKIPSELLK